MIVFPNSKINLGLRVLRKRPDGYHDIETVFYPVPLCDVLEIVDGSKPESVASGTSVPLNGSFMMESGHTLQFSTSGLPVEGDLSKNLCVKACLLFDQHVRVPFNIDMHLHKVIPTGAGLGGGSSDAAFVLTTLNKLTQSQLDTSQLLEMAASLGSDCAFFILNQPTLAQGRGEELSPVDVVLSGYQLVIVKSTAPVVTAQAFAGITPVDSQVDFIHKIKAPISEWQKFLVNDFESTVATTHPEIGEIKSKLLNSGALYTGMSGSGSAVFGIFDKSCPPKNEFPDCFYFKCIL